MDLARDKKLLELLRQVNCSMGDVQVANTKHQDHQLLKGFARISQAYFAKPQRIKPDQAVAFGCPAICSVAVSRHGEASKS